MIGVLFATRKEAAPFLQALGESLPEPRSDLVFTGEGRIVVGICGMGPEKAAAFVPHLLGAAGCQCLINAGIVGALRDHEALQTGALFQIDRVCMDNGGGPGATPMVLTIAWPWAHLPQASLVTTARPVFQRQRRLLLAEKGALVDMEGAAIVREAARAKVPCHLIKVVSDSALPGEKERLYENLPWVCRQLADCLVQGLAKLGVKD